MPSALFSSLHDFPLGLARHAEFERPKCLACVRHKACILRGTNQQCHGTARDREREELLERGVERDLARVGGARIALVGRFAGGELPRRILRVSPQRAVGGAADILNTVAVGLNEVVHQHGSIRTAAEVRAACGLREETQVVLVLTGQDPHLAAMAGHWPVFCSSIATAGYDFVLGPSFSIWDNNSPLYNFRQVVHSLRCCSDLAQTGASVVPAAVWFQRSEMLEVAAAIHSNPSVSLIWVDWPRSQRGKRAAGFEDEYVQFAAELPSRIGVIASGVGAPARVEHVLGLPNVVSIITTNPFMEAMKAPVSRQERGDVFRKKALEALRSC